MTASAQNTLVGKVGDVYVAPYGTAAPFTVPPDATVDALNLVLPAAWAAADLGYLHETDTPTLGLNPSTKDISAWQLDGNIMRTLQTAKIRSMKLTVREINKTTWSLIEPGTTYTAGANGTNTLTIPNASTNPDKAGLFKIQDLDFDVIMWIYIPRMTVKALGDIKFDMSDTANAQVTFNFLSDSGLTTDPLYYLATNHPGFH